MSDIIISSPVDVEDPDSSSSVKAGFGLGDDVEMDGVFAVVVVDVVVVVGDDVVVDVIEEAVVELVDIVGVLEVVDGGGSDVGKVSSTEDSA